MANAEILYQDHSISDFVVHPADIDIEGNQEYLFVSYVDRSMLEKELAKSVHYIATQIPLDILAQCLTLNDMSIVGKIHGIKKSSRMTKAQNLAKFSHHFCPNCKGCYAIFEPVKISEEKRKELLRIKARQRRMAKVFDVDDRSDVLTKPVEQISSKVPCFFLHPPQVQNLSMTSSPDFVRILVPPRFEESGCTVCGQLTLLTDLKKIDGEKIDLNLLKCQGVTRLERFFLGR